MKYLLKTYHYNIPDKDLLNDLRKTANKLKKRKLSGNEYRELGTYYDTTIIKRFGSWNKALLKAGLKINRYITKEDLLDNIKRLWYKLKRQPMMKDLVKPQSDYSVSSYTRFFGTWRNAIETFVSLQQKNSKPYPQLTARSAARPGRKTRAPRRHTQSKSVRFDVMKRDDFKCVLCGSSPATDPTVVLQIDHIIPRSKNGKDKLSNLQTLCRDCNIGKWTKLL